MIELSTEFCPWIKLAWSKLTIVGKIFLILLAIAFVMILSIA